ncbi:UDP-N-acetylglucosamine 2-epimerase [Methylogaea oryzae]|uniref:UDP-N-acetylglucosamine 2-epimerase n=1 Tax=Methylogaea oryzae TaxID=1295382 RepID=UPI0020D05334|nr:UDP-N-acetylglucosamine 2-epimerase [Methylogaea oryzae]
MLLLGDRFEIFAAAQAALLARLPIAHIAGGDVTEGAYDEALRHGISKMAQLHFVTNADAARRLRQMGEDPANVHNVGSPALDLLRDMTFWGRGQLELSLAFRLRPRNLLVTYHPETCPRATKRPWPNCSPPWRAWGRRSA